MFTTNSFACYRHLASRSRAMDVKLKISRPIAQQQMKIKLVGTKTVTYVWHSRGRNCNCTTPWRHHRGVRQDYQPRLQLGPSLRTLKIKGAMLYFSHSLLICALLFLLIPSVVLSQLEWCHGDSVHKKLMHFVRRVRKFSATMSRRAHPLC